MTQDILMSVEDGIATITFNRPEARNAVSPEMSRGLRDSLASIEHDDKVRVVVLRGAGGTFMAGGDIKAFNKAVQSPAAERRRLFEERIHNFHPTIYMMRRMKKPIVASVAGAAAGIGVSFALACDLIIAADTAIFTLAYINIGTSPDGSSTFSLPRAVGLKKAMEIALLGDRFDAASAREIGMVNFVVPEDQLEADTVKLAQRLATQAPVALGRTKLLLNASLQSSMEAQLNDEALNFSECAATDDWIEGVSAFVEKRKPVFKGN